MNKVCLQQNETLRKQRVSVCILASNTSSTHCMPTPGLLHCRIDAPPFADWENAWLGEQFELSLYLVSEVCEHTSRTSNSPRVATTIAGVKAEAYANVVARDQ
jgi:hypothetical protein